MTDLAPVRLNEEEETWLGEQIQWQQFTHTVRVPAGKGEVVALAPRLGYVWVLDGTRFYEVPVRVLMRDYEQDTLL